MWELGFAMALGHPTIVISQTLKELPFDIKDMQTVQYDRNRLGATLGTRLKKTVVDTISAQNRSSGSPTPGSNQSEIVGQLITEMVDLKGMVKQAVLSWAGSGQAEESNEHGYSLSNLEGLWVNRENGTHFYAEMIGSDLIVPYCYQGNESLTGAYFGWRKRGAYWFSRFAWCNPTTPEGFAFLQQTSVDILRGAWWSDNSGLDAPTERPDKDGIPAKWTRSQSGQIPDWVTRFLEDVRKINLSKALGRSLTY